MTIVAAFYSKKPGETVYHNNNRCTQGKNIEKYYVVYGTGDRQLCSTCARLNFDGL